GFLRHSASLHVAKGGSEKRCSAKSASASRCRRFTSERCIVLSFDQRSLGKSASGASTSSFSGGAKRRPENPGGDAANLGPRVKPEDDNLRRQNEAVRPPSTR